MKDKIFDAVKGLCIGDALGIPVEFGSQERDCAGIFFEGNTNER